MTKQSKVLGILGGGQLGRMSALAAARLGIKTHIYTPEKDSPASDVAAHNFVDNYDNKSALKLFAESVDVISYEFENIPCETVRYLSKFKPVYPDERLLEVSQNRLKEKKFLNDLGIETAPWAPAYNEADIDKWLESAKKDQCIIKTTRFGYDGKGQIHHKKSQNSSENWKALSTDEAIIEDVIDFDYEISVVVARDKLSQMAAYAPVLNEHKNHILSKTTAPAPIPEQISREALDMTYRLAEAVDLVGVLALELFVTKSGQVLANEIAPRTHNSGHWTIDACCVSQFEQHVRTVCGFPVGSTAMHSRATMINLIGDDVEKASEYLEKENTCVHLYGKSEARPGRKMGHITILEPLPLVKTRKI